MSKSVEFKPNYAGLDELRNSPGMVDVLISYANQIKSRAGDDYEVYHGPSRANVSVRTANERGAQDNLDNNTLLKAVRG